MKANCIIAGENLRIAQHRDTLRYSQVRSGFYRPLSVKFEPGDFVYVQKPGSTNLHNIVKRLIYKAIEVKPSGVITVQGRCGTTMDVHSRNCAPCHLANINPAIDPTLAEVREYAPCMVCGSPHHEEVMLICDGCNRGYHIGCLDPPLDAVPAEEVWCCPECISKGYTPLLVEALQLQLTESPGRLAQEAALVDAGGKMEQQARELDGRTVQVQITQVGRAPGKATAKLLYIPLGERAHSRRPLMLTIDGQHLRPLSVTQATAALRRPLEVDLRPAAPALEGPSANFTALAFVAASHSNPELAEVHARFQESYELGTAQGLEALYKDVLGPNSKLPAALQHANPAHQPGLPWLDRNAAWGMEEPFSEQQVQSLLSAVDFRPCIRILDPAGVSKVLPEVLHLRYRKKLLAHKKEGPHPSNWLSPRHYREQQALGLVDWVFLYPPLVVADSALGIAAAFARFGAALWVDRAFLNDLTSNRLALLTLLKDQRRLAIIQQFGSSMVWLCVFTSATHRRLMVSADSVALDTWVSF